jgi:type I restriction enzyme S subunit
VAPDTFDTSTPYIGLEHIARKSIVLSIWSTADKATSNKIAFRKGDILFGKIRPYFHKVALTMMDGIASTDAIIIRPRQPELAALALQTIFSDRFVEAATASSTGSKMPRADWKVMRNYGIVIPGKASSVATDYQRLFDGISGKIENNVRENVELTHLRDWLLPLLMNGQVRVAG